MSNVKSKIADQDFVGFVPSSDLSSEEYHAGPGISSTALKEFIKSPLHMKTLLDGGIEKTEALYFGEQFHAGIEGKPFKYEWFKTPGPNQRAEETLKRMIDAVHKHPVCREILAERGEHETSGYVKDAETGLYIKARFDRVQHDGLIVDFKTTSRSAKPEYFERAVFNFGYHISAAWYRRVMSQLNPSSPNEFLFVAIEKKAPFGISVLRLKGDALRFGEEIIAAHLPALGECLSTNNWPGYPAEVRDVGLPSWVMNRAAIFEGEDVA